MARLKYMALVGLMGLLLSGCEEYTEDCAHHGGVLKVVSSRGDENVIIVCRDGHPIKVQS